jgi:hypothetical protein
MPASRPGPLGGSGEFRLGPAGETTAHSINPTTGAVAGFQDTGHVIRNIRKFPGVLLSTGPYLERTCVGLMTAFVGHRDHVQGMQHYVLTQQQSAALGVPEWETIETLVIMLLYHSVISGSSIGKFTPAC